MSLNDIEEYDEVEFPYIVIDFGSLHSNGEIIPERVRFMAVLWEFFNIVLWQEKKLLSGGTRSIEKILDAYYDLNDVKIIICKVERLQKYLDFHKTILITENEKLLSRMGSRAVKSFDAELMVSEFPYIARRKT